MRHLTGVKHACAIPGLPSPPLMTRAGRMSFWTLRAAENEVLKFSVLGCVRPADPEWIRLAKAAKRLGYPDRRAHPQDWQRSTGPVSENSVSSAQGRSGSCPTLRLPDLLDYLSARLFLQQRPRVNQLT